jgi:hypothetical protein
VTVTITKSVAQKLIADVPEDKMFWCHDGRALKNLQELDDALREISDETFSYHLNETKNDFRNWVRDVIGDEKLAGDLEAIADRGLAIKAVADRNVYLKRRARGK